MQTIPKSYDEAAIMDGANWWQEGVWHVILPMSKPALVVCAFMKFIEQWNNFFAGLIHKLPGKIHFAYGNDAPSRIPLLGVMFL